MSNLCLKCNEAWVFEDYFCPCCGSAAVQQESDAPATLEYTFEDGNGNRINPYENNPLFDRDGQKVNFVYDVIRKSTGESVFEEPSNYTNRA